MASIVPMGDGHLAAVAGIFRDATGRPADLDRIRRWNAQAPSVVAVDDVVVGFLLGARLGPDVVEIANLHVVGGARGRGIGTALLAGWERECAEAGRRGAVVVVSRLYEPPAPRDAVPFYEAAGYRTVLDTGPTRLLVKQGLS